MVLRIMHMLQRSTLLATSFGVIGRCKLYMCIGRETMPHTFSIV
ncbi:hypothetical protein LINPERHAP1_LOCUS32223 [Linum perenne]